MAENPKHFINQMKIAFPVDEILKRLTEGEESFQVPIENEFNLYEKILLRTITNDQISDPGIFEEVLALLPPWTISKIIGKYGMSKDAIKLTTFISGILTKEYDRSENNGFIKHMLGKEGFKTQVSFLVMQSIDELNGYQRAAIASNFFTSIFLQGNSFEADGFELYQDLIQCLKYFDVRDIDLLKKIYNLWQEKPLNPKDPFMIQLKAVSEEPKNPIAVERLSKTGLIQVITTRLAAMMGKTESRDIIMNPIGEKFVELGLGV